MSLSFPYILLFVPILLGIWYLFFQEKIGYYIPNPLIKKHLGTPVWILMLWILRGVLLFFLVWMLAWPYMSSLEKVTKKETAHTLILLDISRSMLAEDMSPNRLWWAKKTIKSFLEQRKNDMIGLIIFAWKPFFGLPFSLDYNWIRAFLDNVSPDFIQQEKDWLSWTAIGDAILLANMTFSGIVGKQSIILVTDGRANIGIDPRIAADETAKLGIPLYTIGIWSASGGQLYYTDPITKKRVYFYDESGSILTSDIDENLMKDIAGKTWGKYFRAHDINELLTYFNEIDSITRTPEYSKIETRVIKYEPVFFILAIVFFIIETYWKRYIWKKYKLI